MNKQVNPAFAAVTALSLTACAGLPFRAAEDIRSLPANEVASRTFICQTPPQLQLEVSDLSVTVENGLLPLQSRTATCLSTPGDAYRIWRDAPVAETGRNMYSRAPQAIPMALPVNMPGVFIVALVTGEERVPSVFHIYANSDQYSCFGFFGLAGSEVISGAIVQHTADEKDPVHFQNLATMRAARGASPHTCLPALEAAVSVLGRPAYQQAMRQSFLQRTMPGPRNEA